MIELVSRTWRDQIYELITSTRDSLLIASPFIKTEEAERVAESLRAGPSGRATHLTVMTDLRPDSVLSGSLDIEALAVLAATGAESRVLNVPRLHAKVYIADADRAIVGSANLTGAGLDGNLEYGLSIEDPGLVARIRDDMSTYGQLGSAVDRVTLDTLAELGADLKLRFAALRRSTAAKLRRQFNAHLRNASYAFIATQVGSRTANAVFAEAILYLLAPRPLSTHELHPKVQQLLPDLCDDSVELVINEEAFGKRWKHQVRNAQQSLKRAGLLRYDGKRWARTS